MSAQTAGVAGIPARIGNRAGKYVEAAALRQLCLQHSDAIDALIRAAGEPPSQNRQSPPEGSPHIADYPTVAVVAEAEPVAVPEIPAAALPPPEASQHADSPTGKDGPPAGGNPPKLRQLKLYDVAAQIEGQAANRTVRTDIDCRKVRCRPFVAL